MKKAGIITFMQTNYGAVLQAYATQKYLSDNGVESEIIDFTTPAHLKAHRVLQDLGCKNPIKRLAIYMLTMPHYFAIKRRYRRTEEFKRQYYHRTMRYHSVEQLMNQPPKEDIYITGSDQVFNPNINYIPVYYLGFAPDASVKAAYSPSFGIAKFESLDSTLLKRYLMRFDKLSCRESEGAEYIKTLTGREVPVVLDPVFLLSREQWSSIAITPKEKCDFIFVYDLAGGGNLIRLAQKVKQETGLPIICLTCNSLARYKVDKLIYDAGPAEFVGYISSAKYMVTDSFHGTAFSTIFAKPFYTLIANKQTSSRITNLLSYFGLEDRIVFDVKNFSNKEYHYFDYEGSIMVQKSRSFLNGIINVGY